jgi:hypothetical protein
MTRLATGAIGEIVAKNSRRTSRKSRQMSATLDLAATNLHMGQQEEPQS